MLPITALVLGSQLWSVCLVCQTCAHAVGTQGFLQWPGQHMDQQRQGSGDQLLPAWRAGSTGIHQPGVAGRERMLQRACRSNQVLSTWQVHAACAAAHRAWAVSSALGSDWRGAHAPWSGLPYGCSVCGEASRSEAALRRLARLLQLRMALTWDIATAAPACMHARGSDMSGMLLPVQRCSTRTSGARGSGRRSHGPRWPWCGWCTQWA